jgi:CrcB protein
MPVESLGVALWGCVGVFLRWGAQQAVVRLAEIPSFWATLSINVLGSFLIGVVVAAHEAALLSEVMRISLMVGLLGGFTTFSAFSMESWTLFSQGLWAQGAAYFLLSPALGVLAAGAGLTWMRSLAGAG